MTSQTYEKRTDHAQCYAVAPPCMYIFGARWAATVLMLKRLTGRSLTWPYSLYSRPLPSGMGKNTLPSCGCPSAGVMVSGLYTSVYSADPPAGTCTAHSSKTPAKRQSKLLTPTHADHITCQMCRHGSGCSQHRKHTASRLASHLQELWARPELILYGWPQLPVGAAAVGQRDALAGAGAHVALEAELPGCLALHTHPSQSQQQVAAGSCSASKLCCAAAAACWCGVEQSAVNALHAYVCVDCCWVERHLQLHILPRSQEAVCRQSPRQQRPEICPRWRILAHLST